MVHQLKNQKKTLILLKNLCFSLFIYCLTLLIFIIFYIVTVSKIRQYLNFVDVILVLGCAAPNGKPSGMLQDRLNEAMILYNQGYAPYIMVSGGVGEGEPLSEAAVMYRYLVSKGVPKENILLENRSTRTWENIFFSKEVLDSYGLSKVLIVTSSFHLARAIFTANRLGYTEVYFSGSRFLEYNEDVFMQYIREVVGLVYYIFVSSYLEHNQSTQSRLREVPYIPQYIKKNYSFL